MLKHIYSRIRTFYKTIFPYKILKECEAAKFYKFCFWQPYPIDFSKYNENVQKTFTHLLTNKEEEYLFCYTDSCTIEPDLGWAFTTNKALILESVPGNDYKFRHKWVHHALPNKFDLHFKKRETLNYEEIIFLNLVHNFGKNYYHFYIDLLGQLFLLEKNKIDLNLPIVVHKDIYNTQFFKQILGLSTYLRKLNWVLLDNKYIQTKKSWFVRSLLFQTDLQFYILNKVLELPENKSSQYRKIFITRNRTRVRSISNIEEVELYLNEKGFEIIDCDLLTAFQQIEIFQETKLLIGIHGAGLTNMLFRYPLKMKVIEIFPSDCIFHHYICLADMCNFEYDCIIGGKLNSDNNFYLPLTLLNNL